MKRIFTMLFSIVSLGVYSQSTTVVISQVYGGGGSSTAGPTYNVDYVELHNISAVLQDISGYKIMYGSSAGNLGSSAGNIFTFPATGVTIPAGGYLLVASATPSAGGGPLPLVPDYTFTIAMSATNGKVAFGTAAMLANTTYAGQPVGSVIDFVGFGSANESETSPTGVLSTTTGAVRNTNGCTETNNNNTDFTVTTNPVPRNAASTVNNCGAANPTISAAPNITNLNTTVGTASAEVTYNLSAANLTPASGSIIITPPVGIEVSLNPGGPYTTFPSTLSRSYSLGAITPSIPIYVRITSAASQGVVNATISHTGGGAPIANITISGGVYQNYYNTKTPAAGGLTNVNSWSTTLDGTGPSPSNFTSTYQLFNIVNQANATYSGVWDVTATGNTSKVIVGDGTAALTLTILTGADSLTSATRVDVLNNATLVIQNNRRPFLNNLATGSTVDFAQTGTSTSDTIKIPVLSFHHLKLTNGIKVLTGSTNPTTIRGNFTVNNVINFNGAPSPFSTINSFGDIFFTNGTTFEGNPSGDLNRITLALNGNSGSQSIVGNGTTIQLFRLRRDTISSPEDINLGANTNLILGNNAGGGLQLGTNAATTLYMGSNNLSFIGGAVSTTASLGKIDCQGGAYTINKSTVANNAGTLRFTPGSYVDSLILNFDPTQLKDSITIADNLLVFAGMKFTRGRVVMTAPAVLSMSINATYQQIGTDTAFVDGKLKRNTAFNGGYFFPIGKGLVYRPVVITPIDATPSAYTAEYFQAPYSTLTFNAPLTGVSNSEYWDIAKNSGTNATVSLSLNGTAVPGALSSEEVGVAHFESGNWVSVTGTNITPGNATTGTAVSSVLSTFSPFTFGRILPGITYTFNGTGNWSNAANWSGGLIPPLTLTAPNIIVINPSLGGECVVDVANQHISPGAQFTISANAKLRLLNNLNIQ